MCLNFLSDLAESIEAECLGSWRDTSFYNVFSFEEWQNFDCHTKCFYRSRGELKLTLRELELLMPGYRVTVYRELHHDK